MNFSARYRHGLLLLSNVLILFLVACHDEPKPSDAEQDTEKTSVSTPVFNPNQARAYIEKQVSFGPRVPGTEAQKACAGWLQSEFAKYADTVYRQETEVLQPGSGLRYPAINIIASFNQKAPYRVLLLSHWDSRPWADEDKTDKNKPIDAADDGASGVGVLLEIATHLKQQAPMVGVDMLLVDAEDVGKSEWGEDSYCLGTQYWAANKHIPGYQAMFGICLDMVGAKGAQFPLETYSKNMAGSIQKEIWETAARIGFSSYFPYAESAAITDDHVTINQKAGIPCVDIIYLKPDGRFGDHWHTHNDRLDIIDTGTLKAVGQTVMEVIYSQH